MKNSLLILFFILLFSCTDAKRHIKKKNIIINDSIENAYGSVPKSVVNIDSLIAHYRWLYNSEKINTKIIYGDTTRFIYYHKNFMDYTDTLTIYKPDSIVLRSQLKFMSKKTINFKGKSIVVKKYRQEIERRYPSGNVYINDSLGLILKRFLTHPSGEHIILYNTDKFPILQEAIINDSLFFAPQWFD